ncbi:PLD nuclease N-terminal domain-containing protein [Streptomyces varsoviensis]|uniref:Membrane protein n=1 Tax=Streptomyces varsoviensis TaxID=67373 RepID=A0ABR5IQP1_9ACTN|nr:PLD nuclease N-terminal domain-containing protein [Streptomyces varsoviensis]KOG35818.1 membrane protein [Streptomyces varsoviensis]
MLRYLPFLLILALWIYAFIDCLNTPENEVRGLPKLAWVFIILLFGEVLVGPIAWLAAGRPRAAAGPGGRPGAGAGPRRTWVAPDDNPEFLKSIRDEGAADGKRAARDEELLKSWEADLRRREEELRRKDGGEDAPPKA